MSRLGVVAVSVLCLYSCIKYEPASETVFSPGNDPLVNLTFRSLLERESIDYSINDEGYYVSSLENGNAMRALSDEAYAQLESTSEVELPSQCVEAMMKSYFARENVLFYEREGGIYLKASTANWERLKILENVASANFDCSQDA